MFAKVKNVIIFCLLNQRTWFCFTCKNDHVVSQCCFYALKAKLNKINCEVVFETVRENRLRESLKIIILTHSLEHSSGIKIKKWRLKWTLVFEIKFMSCLEIKVKFLLEKKCARTHFFITSTLHAGTHLLFLSSSLLLSSSSLTSSSLSLKLLCSSFICIVSSRVFYP